MWNSGKKIRALRDKKKIFKLLCCLKKVNRVLSSWADIHKGVPKDLSWDPS
jgi:hypothetical protein